MNKCPKRLGIATAISSSLIFWIVLIGILVANYASTPPPPPPPVVEQITPASLYNLVNAERQKASVPALSLSDKLNSSAQAKCDDMVAGNYYEHTNPATGKHGGQYVYDYEPSATLASENMDEGAMPSNSQVVTDWLNSPDHKAAMLDPKWTDTGFAVCHIPSEAVNSHTIVEHFAIVAATQPVQQAAPQAPARRLQYCNTQYYSSLNSSSTTCL